MSLATIDHLVYATPTLDATVEHLRQKWGVDLVPGGPHPGRGTRNWLAGLGGSTYLEVIGPDPEQPTPSRPRQFGIDELTDARLTSWCVRPNRPLVDVVNDVVSAGADLGTVFAMSRRRPDGVLLEWELTAANPATSDAVVPFCIDWLASEHPTVSLSTNTQLVNLTLAHPDPERLRAVLVAVGLALEVSHGEPSLIATLSTPNGVLTLC